MISAGTPDIQMTHTHDELATAQVYHAIAEFRPPPWCADRRRAPASSDQRSNALRGVLRDISASVVCGVGFADLSGFTALTRR